MPKEKHFNAQTGIECVRILPGNNSENKPTND
jgi:hypothetical protein